MQSGHSKYDGRLPPAEGPVIPNITGPSSRTSSGTSLNSMDSRRGIDYNRLYAYRFKDVDQGQRQLVWNEIATYIYRRMGSPQCVLDPAAGRCEFLNAIPARERWAVDAVDNSEYQGPGITALVDNVSHVELPPQYFDGVFVSNFLEHLRTPDEVAALLTKLWAAMRPNAPVAVIGPNVKYCARQYFDCADHILSLSHISVAEHLYAAGFEIESITSRFLPFSFRGLLPPSPLLTRTYLRTSWIWPFLGKQFLVIARRPEG